MAEFVAGGVIFMVLATVAPLALLALAAIYISLRIRDSRSETPDPELGVKSAFYTFLSGGVLLALSGLTISATDFLNDALSDDKPNQQFQQPQFGPQPKFGPMMPAPRPQPQREDPFDRVSQRVAWPLVISGVLFACVSMLLVVGGTNNANFPSVRRAFGGLRMVIGGFNVMAGVTVAIVLLFQKDVADLRAFSIAIALVGIWFPAAAIELFLLKKAGKLPYYVPPKPKKQPKRDDEFEDEPREEQRKERRERDNKEREERRSREDDEEPRDRRRPPRLPRREDEEPND